MTSSTHALVVSPLDDTGLRLAGALASDGYRGTLLVPPPYSPPTQLPRSLKSGWKVLVRGCRNDLDVLDIVTAIPTTRGGRSALLIRLPLPGALTSPPHFESAFWLEEAAAALALARSFVLQRERSGEGSVLFVLEAPSEASLGWAAASGAIRSGAEALQRLTPAGWQVAVMEGRAGSGLEPTLAGDGSASSWPAMLWPEQPHGTLELLMKGLGGTPPAPPPGRLPEEPAVIEPAPAPPLPVVAVAHPIGRRRIVIRDLCLPFMVGIYPHERLAPQRVLFNVEAVVPETAPFAGKSIDDTVSYATLVEGIQAMSRAGHVDLVEMLAEQVAALCLSDARVASVRVRVEKPDVVAEAAGVGVEIERVRDGG